MQDVLKELTEVLESRKQADPQSSYVAKLYDQGIDKIAKKIGEEATEVVIATKNDSHDEIIYEIADLWFHTMVLLAHKNLSYALVLQELQRRFGLSGLEEKANRK